MANYVDNKKLYQAIKEYHEICKQARDEDKPHPQVPKYIAECLMLIANRVSFKPNFSNYSYRDEMVSDAIENCIKCVLNFDPERGENPFSYFTQVIHYAFIRRIQKEKKQIIAKQRILAELPFDVYDIQEHCDGDEEYTNQFIEFLRENNVYGVPDDLKAPKRAKKIKEEVEDTFDGVLYDEEDTTVDDELLTPVWEDDEE